MDLNEDEVERIRKALENGPNSKELHEVLEETGVMEKFARGVFAKSIQELAVDLMIFTREVEETENMNPDTAHASLNKILGKHLGVSSSRRAGQTGNQARGMMN